MSTKSKKLILDPEHTLQAKGTCWLYSGLKCTYSPRLRRQKGQRGYSKQNKTYFSSHITLSPLPGRDHENLHC